MNLVFEDDQSFKQVIMDTMIPGYILDA